MSDIMYTSASAIESADPKEDGCYRKWYLQKIAKLPEPTRESSTFGDVIHAVAERYLMADENGMDTTGKPVELYPILWEFPINRYTGKPAPVGVSIQEQALIKTLIAKAIEEGVLMRVAGREIERKIAFKAMDGVMINGFIDLLEPRAIRDHKSTKSMRWAKSLKKLKENNQLMVYAYWYFTQGGGNRSLPLTLSHQYFVKDIEAPHVEKREVQVTWEAVEEYWKERIRPVMEMMLTYKKLTNYNEIPLPENPAATCQKFGGCPFGRICTEQETVNDYRKRLEKEISGLNNTDYTNVIGDIKNNSTQKGVTQGEIKMSSALMDTIRKQQALKQALTAAPAVQATPKTVAAPIAAPITAPAVQATPKPAVVTSSRVNMPWHIEGCIACRDNTHGGLRPDGKACPICDIKTKQAGGKMSSKFLWEVGEGTISIYDSETGEEVVSTRIVEPVTASEKIEYVAPPVVVVEAPPVVVVEAPPVVVEAPPAVVEAPVIEVPKTPVSEEVVFDARNFSVERMGFRLLIGCSVVEKGAARKAGMGTKACVISGEELLNFVENEISKAVGTSKWFAMSNFQKRDAVQPFFKHIAESLGSSTVICTHLPKATLLETIVLGLKPFAEEVIMSVNG